MRSFFSFQISHFFYLLKLFLEINHGLNLSFTVLIIYIYDKSTPTNHFIIQSDGRLLYRLDPPVNCNQKSQTVIQQDWAHGAWAALLGGHAYDLTAYRNDFLKLLPLLGWTAKNRTINAADLEKQFNYFILLKTIAVYLKSISGLLQTVTKNISVEQYFL